MRMHNVRCSDRFYGSKLRISSQTLTNKRASSSSVSKKKNIDYKKQWMEMSEEFGKKNTHDWYAADPKSVLNSQLKTVPQGFWKEQPSHRKFFDELGKQIGIQTLDDWYTKLSNKFVLSHGGTVLLQQYNNSCFEALKASYPEHNWVPWKFSSANRGFWNFSSSGFWKSIDNQRKYFDWLGRELGIQSLDDWYDQLTLKVIRDNGGRTLLYYYNESPQAALMASYPDHLWIPWKFTNVPQGFWKDKANQKRFFDNLGNHLGVETPDDWYKKLTHYSVDHYGGGRLLKMYGGSAIEALKAVYPEHAWIPWKFNCVSRGFWRSKHNIGAFLNELSEKLSIQTLDDWYRIDKQQLVQFGAAALLIKYKGLYNLLKEQYPHHPWDPKKFKQTAKKAQRWLAVTLKKIFPNEVILEDYMHPKVMMPSSNRPMQLDVFIPSRCLAFEYQGKQHYQEIGLFCPTRTYQQRDEEKRILCAANNIMLIEVPYWWNRTQESLQEIIDTSSGSV